MVKNYLKNTKICFIIGCQRSGTTLVRLILECHPKIITYDEPKSYDYLRNKNLMMAEINDQKKINKTMFVFKIPNLTEQLNNPDLTARMLEIPPFNFKYENQFLLFLIRDPRDVCHSLKKLNVHPTKGDWIASLPLYISELFPTIIPNFNEKYSGELEIIKNLEKYQFSAIAALYWKIKNDAFFEYDKLGYKLLPLFYENLVSSPKNNISNICKFLNIDFDSNMLRHHELEHSQTKDTGFTLGNTNVRRPIDRHSIKLFENTMDADEQKLVLSIAGKTFKKIQTYN